MKKGDETQAMPQRGKEVRGTRTERTDITAQGSTLQYEPSNLHQSVFYNNFIQFWSSLCCDIRVKHASFQEILEMCNSIIAALFLALKKKKKVI